MHLHFIERVSTNDLDCMYISITEVVFDYIFREFHAYKVKVVYYIVWLLI